MERYQILNIRELLQQKGGTGYEGDIAVFVSDDTEQFALANDVPVYVTAFSYALMLSGEAELSIDENSYSISSNCLCLLSPLHLTYFSKLSPDFRCMFLCLRKEFIDKIGVFNLRQRIAKGLNMHNRPVIHISDAERDILQECILSIRTQILRTTHLYHMELMQNALSRFYLELDGMLDARNIQAVQDTTPAKDSVRLQEFISLLMANFKEQHHVSFYARQMNITPQYLTLTVKRHIGRTVNSLINELLYCEARNMLNSTDLSIQEITAMLNFADQASFSKFFKRQSGMSPLQFRYSSTQQKPAAQKKPELL